MKKQTGRSLCSIIFAADDGERMNSKLPIALQLAGGKPLIDWILEASETAGADKNIVITGYGAEKIKEETDARQGNRASDVLYVYKKKGVGTVTAVSEGLLSDEENGDVIILNCDVPLITSDTLKAAYAAHMADGACATIITAACGSCDDCGGESKKDGFVEKIREENCASSIINAVNIADNVCDINTYIYIFDVSQLKEALKLLKNNKTCAEYELTDVLKTLTDKGGKITTYTAPSEEMLKVSDRVRLAQADELLNKRNVVCLMKNGARILNPDTVRADAEISVGADTVIYPNTILEGKVVIGEDCVIGPNTTLRNVVVGDRTEIQSSVATDSVIGSDTAVGPFAYLRPKSCVGNDVKVGDFVEVKNSNVGNGTKIAHLTYVGDADVGERVNFGCGTVIVNYDGINKHRTVIEDDCFIGCNTNLVSPVTIKRGAYTAAGSTITDEVPEDSLAIARARQVVKEGRAKGRTKNNR